MLKLNNLEYDTILKSQFSPKPEVLHLRKSVVNVSGNQQQIKVEKQEIIKQETIKQEVEVQKNQSPVETEVLEAEKKETLPNVVNNNELATLEELRNVTPKKLFRRKK